MWILLVTIELEQTTQQIGRAVREKSIIKMNSIKGIQTHIAKLSAGLYANVYPFKENPSSIKLHMFSF